MQRNARLAKRWQFDSFAPMPTTLQTLWATTDGRLNARLHELGDRDIVVDQRIGGRAVGTSDPRVLTFAERGLSRSRNRALDAASATLCVIADDDVRHVSGFREIVIESFDADSRADIITFQIVTPDGEPFKRYADRACWHGPRSLLRVSSVEIAFRREAVLRAGLRFDESFGLGAKWPTGEELIFLQDARRAGLRIRYIPVPIAIHPSESSGAQLAGNPALAPAKGAMFERMFGWMAPAAMLAFALRHHRSAGVSPGALFRAMRLGSKAFGQQQAAPTPPGDTPATCRTAAAATKQSHQAAEA
jgi:hypothetical protein